MSHKPNLKSVLQSTNRQAKPTTSNQRTNNSKLIYETGSTIIVNESSKNTDKKYKKTENISYNTKLLKNEVEKIEKTDNSQNTNENMKKTPSDSRQNIKGKTDKIDKNDIKTDYKKGYPLTNSTSSSKLLGFVNSNFEDNSIKKSSK